jgi:hypothetical protein
MNILIKAGLIFLIIGGLSFLGLMYVVLQFGVGGASNPPLTGWFAALVSLVFAIGFFWFVFLIVGAVLIVAGLIKKYYSRR